MRLKLLLTRPEAQSRDFANALEAELPDLFAPVIAPVIAIAPRPGPVDLTGIGALVFSSANGVAQFAAACADRSLPAFCVGDITAEAARQAGFTAHSAQGDVAALADLAIARHDPASGALLHIRGTKAAGDLISRLTSAGLTARALELYDQTPCAIGPEAAALLARGEMPLVAFFSPRSAALFAGQARAGGWDLSRTTAVCLSAAVAQALGDLPLARRVIARQPDRGGMIAALARL